VIGWLLAGAAVALAAERACYVWIARAPASFRAWCARPALAWLGDPVDVVEILFCAFKVLQAAVFAAWGWAHGGPELTRSRWALGVALVLVVAGQILNVSVFYRLGRIGVFFGDRFGHRLPWCRAFPFSVLSHPQYVGAVATIWGLFLALRFPHPDWSALPLLETVYYAVGAALERGHPVAGSRPGARRALRGARRAVARVGRGPRSRAVRGVPRVPAPARDRR